MYERFTDRSRKIMQLANQEAQRRRQDYIGTEHLLVGLVQEGSGVAALALRNLGLDLRKVRNEIEQCVFAAPGIARCRRLPMTPRVKKSIEYAIEEARGLNHNYVGTEHLLLGLIRQTDGVAAQVLMNLGLRLDDVRREVIRVLESGPAFTTPEPTSPLRDEAGNALRPHVLDRPLFPQGGTQPTPAAGPPDTSALQARLDAQQNRIHALETQLATVRFLLGGLVGAGAGGALGGPLGVLLGLLAGGVLAFLGRLVPAVLAATAAGAFLGSGYFKDDFGVVGGAVLGALVAGCLMEVGRRGRS